MKTIDELIEEYRESVKSYWEFVGVNNECLSNNRRRPSSEELEHFLWVFSYGAFFREQAMRRIIVVETRERFLGLTCEEIREIEKEIRDTLR